MPARSSCSISPDDARRADAPTMIDGGRATARARVTMRAGDVAAMPADIRHRGFSTKRSMLLVWENGSPKIPDLIRDGKAPVVPVKF